MLAVISMLLSHDRRPGPFTNFLLHLFHLDDMNVSQRVKRVKRTKKDKKAVFSDLALSAYMLFYELDRSCSYCRYEDDAVDETLSETSQLDNQLTDKLKTLEVKGSDGRLYSCNLM